VAIAAGVPLALVVAIALLRGYRIDLHLGRGDRRGDDQDGR
jgi:hypothetical protein